MGCARRSGLARCARAVLLTGLPALALLGCSPTISTHGHRPDPAAAAQIKPGQTTRDQVVQLLGSPSAITTFGNSPWYYISQRTETESFYQEEVVGQQVMAINFDDQGVVSSIERHTLADAREVDPVSRETPTAGTDLNILEQFIGNIGRFNPAPRDADTGR